MQHLTTKNFSLYLFYYTRRAWLTALLSLFGLLCVTMLVSADGQNIYQTDLISPDGSSAYGKQVVVLPNGNIVVADPNYSTPATPNVGAIYLYNGETFGLISNFTGSNAHDHVGSGINFIGGAAGITVLSNGNFIVSSPFWNNSRGAATWVNGTTGLSGIISEQNSLIGVNPSSDVIPFVGDLVGQRLFALDNGNYVVVSETWEYYRGAATWANGATGITGIISASNSLVGEMPNDYVGVDGIVLLSNGNYLVRSPFWNVSRGAVTWVNGATGIVGVVSASNSLVGSSMYDYVGYTPHIASEGIILLSNGNYVVASLYWNNGAVQDAGAVTWGSGSSGVTGLVSITNSLIGTRANDWVGHAGAAPAITPLSNGNYIVASPWWDSAAAADIGAVTWGNGVSGTNGIISAANSLIGSQENDRIGLFPGCYCNAVTPLSNGNYVVNSPLWSSGNANFVGAVTWGSGTGGTTGVVSAANSLVGEALFDRVGINGTVALPNGNYVVSSPDWGTNRGAATWGDGTSGVNGPVSAANSLVGSSTSDRVGWQVKVLGNGNYVVSSPYWTNTEPYLAQAGAVTWGNGLTGISGAVSLTNSLIGSSSDDRVGSVGSIGSPLNGVTPLSNGHYVVASSRWNNGPVADVGAITWVNGATGATGYVSTTNSLVGSSPNDQIGSPYADNPESGVVALSNGNYVVASPYWDNGAVMDAGAVTWLSGMGSAAGVVSTMNSLVGDNIFDFVGSHGVTALPNGNYVVRSRYWNNMNAGKVEVGAVTWGSGASGVQGIVSPTNSLVGSGDIDWVGAEALTILSNGDYLVYTPTWDNGANVDAGALSWGFGAFGTTGLISGQNSVLGTMNNQGNSMSFQAANNNLRLVIGRDLDQIVTIVELQPRLIVYRAGTGSGTITSDPPGIDCGTDCTELFDPNTLVTLTATPAPGSTFDGWSGACNGPVFCIVTMDEARTVTAHFTADVHLLSVSLAGTGGGTVTSDPPGINCGADCTEMYNHGIVVTLTATPAAGSIFDGWSGACTGLGACIVTMEAARSVTATFTASINTYLLTVILAGDGDGTVTSDPPGIDCGTDCTESYNAGTVVTLTATPAGGSTFAGWSGACAGTGSCVVTMSAARTVAATFVTSSSTYLLTVIQDGSGTGTVTSSPAGIHCGADCTESYDPGTVVTLSAIPAGGSFFAGWSGPCSGQGSCVVTMDAAKTVIATFTVQINTYLLTVSRTGDGTGLVTSNPIGINCGADCTESYTQGTLVTLSATSTLGSTFAGWSGACTGQGSCYVVMDGARNVTATFIQASVIKLYLPTMTRP